MTRSSTTDGASGVLTAAQKNSGINRDEWLKALSEAGAAQLVESDPLAVTIAEFAEMLSVTRNTAAKRMALLERTGKAERTTKVGRGSDGRVFRSAAFRLVP